MSTDYDVRCLDCGVDHGFYDANHERDLMMHVAKCGPELAAMAPLIAKLRAGVICGDVNLKLGYDRWPVDFAWFEKHGSHRLIAVDEYGRCVDECGDYFACDACAHRKLCRRPKGHVGEHSEKRDPEMIAEPSSHSRSEKP